jgi:hypothetical protein
MYNNPNPNNYDPTQDNLKAQYFNNLVYTYNGIYLNYTKRVDIINYQTIYNFNYYFAITDKTTRTFYNNDTFLCDQESTVNPYMVQGFEHLYVSDSYQKLYFYNNQCMLSYPDINTNNWAYYNASFCILIISVTLYASLLLIMICAVCIRVPQPYHERYIPKRHF